MVTADTKQLQRGLGRGQKAVSRFGDGAISKLKSLGTGLAIGVGAAAGAMAVSAMRKAIDAVSQEVKKQLSEIDEIGKLSDRLGITTQNLAALRLQAGLAGVGAQELNAAMRAMLRNVGDATRGIGSARDTLIQLRLSAKQLANLETGDQFRVIAQRISEIDTAAGRAAAAYKIFGRNGVQLLSAIKDGAAGVDKARQRASQLGLTLTREEAARIEQANDAMLEMKLALSGVARRMTVELAPAITVVARQMTELIASTHAFRGAIKVTFNALFIATAKAINALQHLQNAQKKAHLQGLEAARAMAFGQLVSAEAANRVLDNDTTRSALAEARKNLEETTSNVMAMRQSIARPLLGDQMLNWLHSVKKEAAETAANWRAAGAASTAAGRQMLAAGQGAAQAAAMAGGAAGQDLLEPIRQVYQMTQQLARAGDTSALERLREQILGWDDPLNRQVVALNAMRKALREFNAEAGRAHLDKLKDDAKQLWESTRTPLEQMRIEYEKIKDLYQRGLISRDTANRALGQARERLMGGELARAESGSLSRTALTTGVVANKRDQATAELKKQNGTLERIEQNTRQRTATAG